MTWVQPDESVICWRLRWGGGALRRVMVSGVFDTLERGVSSGGRKGILQQKRCFAQPLGL